MTSLPPQPPASSEPSLRARKLRGTFLLAWLPAIVACFLPIVLGLSPASAVVELGSAISRPVVEGMIFLDRPTQLLLLCLALGACSPLLALPWRLAFVYRNPDSDMTRRTGRALVIAIAAVNAVAVAVLLIGVLQGDASMAAPLVGELVGLGALAILLLPRWRALPVGLRLMGSMNAGFMGSALAALAITASTESPGWWLLAWGAAVAAAELGALPKME